MDKKNMILLTVIAVATLLIAVVGATFAYFTASTNLTNGGQTSTATTSQLSDVGLSVTADLSYESMAYPGGFSVVGVKAETSKGATDTHNYRISYNVDMEFTNETGTALTWTLYEKSSQLTNADSCTLQENNETAGETHYWYTCTTTNDYGTQVQTGTVAAGANAVRVSTTALESLDTTNSTYYYLVVNYPNDASSNQYTADGNKKIESKIVGVSNVTTAQI